jgi:hypothetical protein
MKKIVLVIAGLLFLVSFASAYQVYIYAPSMISIGEPLVVNGTTTFGIGTPIDVVLYQQVTTSTEVKRKIAYVQSDKTFRVVFDTTNLPKGTYKVEVPASGMGDSVSMRQVKLVDRSDEITLSSQERQVLTGKLSVSGSAFGDLNSGIQIEVFGPDGGVIYGPAYIATDSVGHFSAVIPATQEGDYEVTFTDRSGYIGEKTISIVNGNPSVIVVQTTQKPEGQVISVQNRASRTDPAYFMVDPANPSFTVSTSTSVDWVIEYIDENGVVHTINDQGDENGEEIDIAANKSPVYFKVYPYKYTVSNTVVFTAENVADLQVITNAPAGFDSGVVIGSTSAESVASNPEKTAQSPLPLSVGIAALAVACALVAVRKR